MNGFIQFFATIVGIASGIISIVTSIRGFRKKSRATNNNLIYSLLAITGILIISISLYFGTILPPKPSEATRYRFTVIQGQVYDIILDYQTVLDDTLRPFPQQRIANMQIKANELYKELSRESDHNLDIGLRIYKHDNLTYLLVLLASFESVLNNKAGALNFSEQAIKEARTTLDYISELRNLNARQGNTTYLGLIKWIDNDQFENRIHYLWGWALVLKLYHADGYTTPEMVEDQFNKITPFSYFLLYPLNSNYHIKIIGDRLSDEFRCAHGL
jgi:hypothetical protein